VKICLVWKSGFLCLPQSTQSRRAARLGWLALRDLESDIPRNHSNICTPCSRCVGSQQVFQCITFVWLSYLNPSVNAHPRCNFYLSAHAQVPIGAAGAGRTSLLDGLRHYCNSRTACLLGLLPKHHCGLRPPYPHTVLVIISVRT
jgi:hypothetical protein